MALHNQGGRARRSIYIWASDISNMKNTDKVGGETGGREGVGGWRAGGGHERYKIREKTKCLWNKGRQAKEGLKDG